MTPQRDVFAEARERYTILDLWTLLGLPGEPPRPGTKFRSPFRPDRNPSCDISKCGRWFADRSHGLYLDPIAFIRHTLDCSCSEARVWLGQVCCFSPAQEELQTSTTPRTSTAERESRTDNLAARKKITVVSGYSEAVIPASDDVRSANREESKG